MKSYFQLEYKQHYILYQANFHRGFITQHRLLAYIIVMTCFEQVFLYLYTQIKCRQKDQIDRFLLNRYAYQINYFFL